MVVYKNVFESPVFLIWCFFVFSFFTKMTCFFLMLKSENITAKECKISLFQWDGKWLKAVNLTWKIKDVLIQFFTSCPWLSSCRTCFWWHRPCRRWRCSRGCRYQLQRGCLINFLMGNFSLFFQNKKIFETYDISFQESWNIHPLEHWRKL